MSNRIKKEKSRPGKKKKILVYGLLTVTTLLIAFITECVNGLAYSILIGLGTFITNIIGIVYNVHFERSTNKDEESQEITLVDGCCILCRDVAKAFRTKPIVKLSAAACLAVLIGVMAGLFSIYGRLVAFATYDPQNPPIVQEETEQEVELNSEDEEWFEQQDPTLISKVEGIKIAEADLNAEHYLSEKDRNKVFFLSGKYAVQNWDDEEEIISKVRNFVWDKVSLQSENIFDKPALEGGADEATRGKIARISEEEQTIEWFSQREENMYERQDIYSQTPKGSLASLISNDEHFLALVLYRYDGNKNSILYYYSKSIEYRMERISYKDISMDHIKAELEWTSARYADIVYTCPSCEEREYAQKLQNAFAEVAKEF